MLIWKGHGILILVFAVIGGMAASMGIGLLYGATQWGWLGNLLLCIPFWGAAAGVWLYATTMGKPTERTLIDPRTGVPVVMRSSHTLFFIPAFPWAIIASIFALITTFIAITAPILFKDTEAAMGTGKGGAAFEQANDLIDSDHGPAGYGNTKDAEKLAERFSAYVKIGRKLGVEAATKPTVSLSNGKFLTYCRLNKDSCVFMVHVPSLRKFSGDAKEFMASMAWAAALNAVEALEPKPKQVAVGLRGIVLYDTVIVGHPVEEDEETESGIENLYSSGSPKNYLFTFFEPQPAGGSLPKLKPSDEAKLAAKAEPKPRTKAVPPVPVLTAEEALDEAMKKLAALDGPVKDGIKPVTQVLAENYADVVRTMALNYIRSSSDAPEFPHFQAVANLRNDSAAFIVKMPESETLGKDVMEIIVRQAWETAVAEAGFMVPLPSRIAVMIVNRGEVELLQAGGAKAGGAKEWVVDQTAKGDEGKKAMLPFFEASQGVPVKVTALVQVLFHKKPMNASSSANPPTQTSPPVASNPAPVLPTQVRDWKDSTGRIMKASLEKFTTPVCDVGHFKREDGQGFDVPVARLSAEDQALIGKFAEQVKTQAK